ncbi:unnamed protein product [Haemonchus placei]|uniref:Apple domain-containing protein n=1 Tax=Haemonchus placei TaxID=6290 RepID=A0A0N4WA48_HAEPC|nr:unnamed protein product [Haemonchus placei]
MDLPSFIRTYPDIKVQMHADDITVYACSNSYNENTVKAALKNSIMKLTEWAAVWGLSVNLNKCSVFHIGEGAAGVYELNGTVLKTCHTIRELGVFINDNLKFTDHFDKVTKYAYAVLYLIFRNLSSKDTRTLLRLYKALVLPNLGVLFPRMESYPEKGHIKVREGNYLDINECFVELPNFQLTVDSMAVESVEFKDDCLRACLRSFLRGKPCAGAEHRPKDNACVLSEKTGERRLNNEPKTGSYFENVCARPQG